MESEVLRFGPSTRFGHLQFNNGYRNLILYDSENSFTAVDPNCVLGIWERDSLLDFNKIVCVVNKNDATKFNILLIQ